MVVRGFTFIRNAVKFDYPVSEAIRSILPLCSEVVVALGNSSDDTAQLVKAINPEKVRTIDTIWDDNLREGGRVFALETDKALEAARAGADWLVYIQGDECIHEKYLDTIRQAMQRYQHDDNVEGLLLHYKHFYASYDYTAQSRRWYRREIRVIKNLSGIHSYRDAQGFRRNGRKLKVKLIDAWVYHYGWVKPPQALVGKMRNFNQFYNPPEWIEQHLPAGTEFDFGNADRLVKFTGTHPQVMQARIAAVNWQFKEDLSTLRPKLNMKRRFLQWFEQLTGVRLFEYRNYKIV